MSNTPFPLKLKSARVGLACIHCRKRKSKCDGNNPCRDCVATGKECYYTAVKPTQKDLSIEGLHTTLSRIELLVANKRPVEQLQASIDVLLSAKLNGDSTERVQTMHPIELPPIMMEGSNNYMYWLHHRHLLKDHVHGISTLETLTNIQTDFGSHLLRLEVYRAPSASEGLMDSGLHAAIPERLLFKLLESYLETIHILHPILTEPRIMFENFRKHHGRLFNVTEVVLGEITTSVENATVLLMLALGEVCADNGLPPDSQNCKILPGMAYFSRAVAMLATMMGGHTLEHARAMILAALFLNQSAKPVESFVWISHACRITEVLLVKMFADFVSLAVDDDVNLYREILVVYWTCLRLEGDTIICLPTLPLSHLRTFMERAMILTANIPIQFHYLWERFLLDARTSETLLEPFRTRDRNWKAIMRKHIAMKKYWPEDKRLLDGTRPSSELGLTALRARYYSVSSRVLYPSLADSYCDREFLLSLEETLPEHNEIREAICDCINYTLQSITVFDGVVPAHRFVLYKAASTLHRQFEAILVLHGFYASDLYPKLGGATELTTATLKDALAQTKKNISDFKYGSPILEVDYRILCNIQQQLRTKDWKTTMGIGGMSG